MKSEVYNKITRTLRDAAMLLHLLRIIMDAMKFHVFHKFKELTTDEKTCQECRSISKRWELV
jgi:hypothetical protein